MNMISQIEELRKKFSGKILFDENLSKYSWFNLGGPAKIVFKPKNLNELSTFLKKTKDLSKIKILGAGSNTLFRDGGFNGIIIKLSKSFSHLSLFNENTIIAGSSILDKNLSNFALENSLSGFEFLSCIPGSIGGAIVMNSGCYGDDISKIFHSMKTINLNGEIETFSKDQMNFFYRGCSIKENLIILSAILKGKTSKKKNILKRKKQ